VKTIFSTLSPRSAARTAAVRLFMAALPLSILIGVAVWYYQTERLEQRVLTDAVQDAHQVTYGDMNQFLRNERTLQDLHQVVKKVLGDFVSVEIYNTAGQEIVQELNERANLISPELWHRAENMPLSPKPTYDQIFRHRHMVIITVVPIENEAGDINGYLKGIYVVTDAMLAEMQEDSFGAIVVAVISVLISMLVVFPIILFMQRQDANQTSRVLEGNMALLEVLGNAVAYRDSDTDSHNYRVTLYAVRLGQHLGLSHDQIRLLIVGAFLHDIGKIGISDAILLKPGKLTPEEFAVMKTHVEIGSDIVRRSPWLAEAVSVVECHHEKYDGSGYPRGLAGASIPLEARIFAIVDVFDALTSRRPYKEPFTFPAAIEILTREGGRHFDPQVLQKFEAIAPQLYREIGEASHDHLRLTLHECGQKYLVDLGGA